MKSDLSVTFLPNVITACALLHNVLLGQCHGNVERLLQVLRTEGLQEEPLDEQHAFVVDAVEAIRDDYAHWQGNDKCRAPLLEECPQHHGHKGDPGVTPGTCGAIGERAQVILMWVRAPGRWERLPPTETRSHEG